MLLARWISQEAAEHFLADAYAHFLDLAFPVLAHAPTAPERADLHLNWAWPEAMDGAGPTALYRHTFSTVAPEDQGHTLLGDLDAYTQCLDGDPDPANEGYLGSGWAWTLSPTTGQRTKTLYIAISWESLEAQARSEQQYCFADGDPQVNVMFHDSVLSKADAGGECFHVEWVAISREKSCKRREAQSLPLENAGEGKENVV